MLDFDGNQPESAFVHSGGGIAKRCHELTFVPKIKQYICVEKLILKQKYKRRIPLFLLTIWTVPVLPYCGDGRYSDIW